MYFLLHLTDTSFPIVFLCGCLLFLSVSSCGTLPPILGGSSQPFPLQTAPVPIQSPTSNRERPSDVSPGKPTLSPRPLPPLMSQVPTILHSSELLPSSPLASRDVRTATRQYLSLRSDYILRKGFRQALNGFWGGQTAGGIDPDGPPSYYILLATEVPGGDTTFVDPAVQGYFALERAIATASLAALEEVRKSNQAYLNAELRAGLGKVLHSSKQQQEDEEDRQSALLRTAWKAWAEDAKRRTGQALLTEASNDLFNYVAATYGRDYSAEIKAIWRRPLEPAYVEQQWEQWFQAQYLHTKASLVTTSSDTLDRFDSLYQALDQGEIQGMRAGNWLVGSCNRGQLYAVRLLVSRQISPDVLNSEGQAALHEVVTHGDGKINLQIAQVLLAHGASVQLKNHKGQTPLDIMFEQKGENLALKELLLEQVRPLALSGDPGSDIYVCNHTAYRIVVALAYTAGQNQVAEGWWGLAPRHCNLLQRGQRGLVYGYATVRAELGGREQVFWRPQGADASFCIAAGTYGPFSTDFKNEKSRRGCEGQQRPFGLIINNGQGPYTWDLR